MTDEMRVALVALASANGLAAREAWDVVDQIAADAPSGDLRCLVLQIAERSNGTAWSVD